MKIVKVQIAKWKRFRHVFPYYFKLKQLPKHRMVDFYHVRLLVVGKIRIPFFRVHDSIECDCGEVFHRRKSFNKIIRDEKVDR